MSGNKHMEMLSRLGMAGAIVPTFLEKKENWKRKPVEVTKEMLLVQHYVKKSIKIFGGAGQENVDKIGRKIDLMRELTCLGKERSILTFIDFSVELLELALHRPKPLAGIQGGRGIRAVKDLAGALTAFRFALGGNRDHTLCILAGIKAAETWHNTPIGGI
jgi:hypothetical protein